MKKLILLLIIFFIVLFNINTKAFLTKSIDLKIKDNDLDIVFIKLKGSISLLINDENDSNLFILWYKSDRNLSEALKIFKSKPNIFYLNRNIDKMIDNIHVFKYDNVLKFTINNYTLCVGDGGVGNCDFIYLLVLNKPFNVNDNVLNVFYDEFLDEKYFKNLEESWVDRTIVSENSFTILKITEESYNILVVPSTND